MRRALRDSILSFVRLGAALDGGTSLFLQRSIGVARARALALLGEPLAAETAAEWGLIWKAVDDADLLNEALAVAQKLSEGPPVSLGLIKGQIEAAWNASLASTLEMKLRRKPAPSLPRICARERRPLCKSAGAVHRPISDF